jgi:hypothetical protein
MKITLEMQLEIEDLITDFTGRRNDLRTRTEIKTMLTYLFQKTAKSVRCFTSKDDNKKIICMISFSDSLEFNDLLNSETDNPDKHYKLSITLNPQGK